MRQLRLIDLGDVSALRSHAAYHALAVGAPEALLLAVPGERYVSIGAYQELARDIDSAFCREQAIPVYRRRIGGQTLFFGPDQQLFQVVTRGHRAATSLARTCQDVLGALGETYHAFGVDVHTVPANQIYLRRSRMGGMAAGRLDSAIIIASSVVYRFEGGTMGRILRPGKQPRFTSIEKELRKLPDCAEVKAALVERLAEALEAKLVPGKLSDREQREIDRLEAEFARHEWTGEMDARLAALRQSAGADSRVTEGAHAAEGGTIRATVRTTHHTIDHLVLSGDFSFCGEHLRGLEKAFRGISTGWDALMTVAENYWLTYDIDSPGTAPADWVAAISAACQ